MPRNLVGSHAYALSGLARSYLVKYVYGSYLNVMLNVQLSVFPHFKGTYIRTYRAMANLLFL